MSAERPTLAFDLQAGKKKRRKIIAASAVAATLAVCCGAGAILRSREDNSDRGVPVAPTTSVTEQVTEPVPSFSSETPSAFPSLPSVEASPPIDLDKVPEQVLDVVPQLGMVTYTGGANIDTEYASGVVVGPNQFLTSGDLFGPRPEDPTALCGDYRATNYKYQIKTGAVEHDVVSVRRHPDETINLAILTVEDSFDAESSPVEVADAMAEGSVYVFNYQDARDQTHRSPRTGAHLFAGTLASPISDTQRQIDNNYYGSRKWETSVVKTPDDFGFDPQTGKKDTTQEGYAGAIGSGGPLVTPDGLIVGIQSAPTADGPDRGFLATRVTTDRVIDTLHAPAQAC